MGSTEEREIERKFLVDIPQLKPLLQEDTSGRRYTEMWQAYLVPGAVSVRVRLKAPPGVPVEGELTVKGPGTLSRFEKNVDLPEEHVRALLKVLPKAIHKNRYRRGRWELDSFLNVLDPETGGELWLAEIELEDETETFTKPPWLGREVTEDLRYTNAKLSEQVLG